MAVIPTEDSFSLFYQLQTSVTTMSSSLAKSMKSTIFLTTFLEDFSEMEDFREILRPWTSYASSLFAPPRASRLLLTARSTQRKFMIDPDRSSVAFMYAEIVNNLLSALMSHPSEALPSTTPVSVTMTLALSHLASAPQSCPACRRGPSAPSNGSSPCWSISGT